MALKIDAEKWRRIRGLPRLLEALGADSGFTRYVGGAVRDDLLGVRTSDVDLATRIAPRDVMERLVAAKIKAVPTGIEHGTVTAVSDGHPFEVTTLRRDVTTDGRRATVAFTDDWEEDAARRDFTINALFADPMTGELFDYFGGLQDLQQGHVRFIGDPLQRIFEDHLRILRFFRFHARFGVGDPDAPALDACIARANDLMALSRERIADELLKLLSLPDPANAVSIMVRAGILRPVLPEIVADRLSGLRNLIACEQEAGIAPDPLRRLAALIADVATARDIAARLRLSIKASKRLACALAPSAEPDAHALAYRRGTDCAVDHLLLRGEPLKAASIVKWQPPRLPIGGGTLIALGLSPGPIVARTLRRIEDEWVSSGFVTGSALDAIVDGALRSA